MQQNKQGTLGDNIQQEDHQRQTAKGKKMLQADNP